jgi:ABC-type transporter Mla subunit MlaD
LRRLLVTMAVVLAATCLWLGLQHSSIHRLMLRAYYQHAQNVKKGMPVCVDGVEIGSVTSVTVRPELGERPVELVLQLRTPYELRIPAGSTAQIVEPGVLRPTVVDIDTRSANGPPVADGGTIPGLESTEDHAAHALGVVVKALVDQSNTEVKQPAARPVPSK